MSLYPAAIWDHQDTKIFMCSFSSEVAKGLRQ
jgi:hypothetical protein